MKKYIIKDVNSVYDFAGSLIGMTFESTGTEVKNDITYIKLNTCDGELLFNENEVEEVKNIFTIEYVRAENLNNPVCRQYTNRNTDEMQDIFDKQVKILKKQNKECIQADYLGGLVLKAVLKENDKIVMEQYFID